MPAKLEIDREQVRLLVIQHGVRETAKMLGLPYQTVGSWSSRFGWIAALQTPAPKLPPSMSKPANGANNAPISPVDAATEAYRDERVRARLNYSKAALAVSEEIASLPGKALLADGGQAFKNVVQTTAIIHGWQEQTQSRVVVCLQALEQSSVATLDVTPTESGDAHDPMFD